MKIYKIAEIKEPRYTINKIDFDLYDKNGKKYEEYGIYKGILKDANDEDVFSIKELGQYKVPLFRSPEQANDFLENLDRNGITRKDKKTWGRLEEGKDIDSIVKEQVKNITDSKKDKQDAKLKEHLERNRNIKKGLI